MRGSAAFARYLGARLELDAQVAIAEDYGDLYDVLLAGAVTVAWLPPLLVSRAARMGARIAAVSTRAGRQTFRAAIVTHRDSPYDRLDQLAGARAAWVDARSMSGYVFPRLYLAAAGLDPDQALGSERFYGTAQLACQAVASQEADFAACYVTAAVEDSVSRAQAELPRWVGEPAERLKVIGVTDQIPADAAVVSAVTPPGLAGTVADALLQMHQDSEGASALDLLLHAERLTAPTPEYLDTLALLAAIHSPADGQA